MVNTNRDFKLHERVQCNTFQELKTTALILSSKGYGVAILGFADMSDDILTITAVPESANDKERT